MKQNIYLEKRPLSEALKLFLGAFDFEAAAGHEEIRSVQSCNRITSGPVFARISSPNYNAAAMDGIAVRARDTEGATEASPRRLSPDDGFVFINTGNPLPADRDAVIMIEDVSRIDDNTIEIIKAAVPYQHVRAMGEDMVATELVLSAGHTIRPYDIGALLGAGHTTVAVRRQPRVLLIPTGDELVPDTAADLPENKVYESNSAVIAAMIAADGGIAERHAIVRDDYNSIRLAVTENVDGFDLIIIIAGSSAGTRDYTKSIVEDLGKVFVHGIAIMPGKPTILGAVAKKPVVGLPGYPVSAVMTYQTVVRPLIARMQGARIHPDETAQVVVLRDIPKAIGNDLFLRVQMAEIDGRLVASPLPRGAGNITTMVKADGIVTIDSLSEGLKSGDTATAVLLKRREDIANTIMAVGSHDISLDLLAGRLRALYPSFRLSSVNVGSLGGIMALKNGECHLAGSHLLDPETGRYNIPSVGRYLKTMPVSLVTLAHREQGLIVQKGNPSGIRGIADLTRNGIVFVNRQRGSGTRILLDYLLKKMGIEGSGIDGYGREEFTHLLVAAAVKSARADAGLGIRAAARALDLDFIPIEHEQYDLIIPAKYRRDERIVALIQTISDDRFKDEMRSLGGYDTAQTGKEEIIDG
jgi:putative molybdopterin biosynthesis protein